MTICKEVFIAALAMQIVDHQFQGSGDGFAAYIGDERVPDELIREVNNETPLIWSVKKLIFRSDWERSKNVSS